MPSTVEQLSPTRVKITVEVPFADLKPSMDKAYRRDRQDGEHPGFRRARCRRWSSTSGSGAASSSRRRSTTRWQRFYGAAVDENNLTPAGPARRRGHQARGRRPDRVHRRGGRAARVRAAGPGHADGPVDAARRARQPGRRAGRTPAQPLRRPETVERPAADGDVVTINLVATKDGEPLADATAEDLEYTVGSRPDARRAGRGRHRARRPASPPSFTLHPGRRPAEGRGSRHRGHGHQGAGPGAARGRRRVRPAGLGVRHASRRCAPTSRDRLVGAGAAGAGRRRPATPCSRT